MSLFKFNVIVNVDVVVIVLVVDYKVLLNLDDDVVGEIV